ncbi:hypothetical protein SNE40_021764 [Patella caerulea]|uniref:NXPE C-terminal domain-containing protein n=1 Tax=Patella caerulea TaxID=87958 RepID=A0AAN8GBN1_PATCE
MILFNCISNDNFMCLTGRERNERHLLPICHRLPKFKTWDLSLPTGYASKKQYFPMYCRINQTNQDLFNCLKNTTLILSGDSTTKNWFTELIPFTQCNLTSGNLGTDPRTKWSIVAECVNRSTNFKMQWKAHNMPISTLNMERSSTDNRLRAKSIGQMLDEIPTEGKHIFVIHINAHLSRNHYYIMRKILRRIATALRRTIGRNKELFVAIKGPSMFIRRWKPAMNDFNCPFFEKIMMEEFYEFRERVVYLNMWDMNMAYGEKDLHPKDPMLWNMLRLLFGYACS